MITKELIHSKKGKSILKEKDLDTKEFICSLIDFDDIDITDASSFLKKFVKIDSPVRELALDSIAFNFQYYKQHDDIVSLSIEKNNVLGAVAEHSVLGFYALLKEFVTPYANDWVLEQKCTYSPLKNTCVEQDIWVSKKSNVSLAWGAASQLLADLIILRIEHAKASISNELKRRLEEKDLGIFFDLNEFYSLTGSEDYRDLVTRLI